jgi:hypothetical protein
MRLLAIAGILVFAGWLLMQNGVYGFSLFLLLPMLAGGAGAVLRHARNARQASFLGMQTACLGCLLFLLLGFEGLFCVAMSLPLAAPFGALGGYLAHQLKQPRQARFMLALAPAALGWDIFATPPVRPVVTTIEIAAPPQIVWKNVVEFPDLAPPTEWYFRAGLAYPQRARIVDGVRYCEFSTGAFVEPITTWEEPRLLAFRVTENPPPMQELTPYGHVDPRHLHGFMESKRGQFRLIPVDGGRATRLEGTTWYRHGLWPDVYWRLWSDAIIHRIHLRVLNHIRGLSEGTPASQ